MSTIIMTTFGATHLSRWDQLRSHIVEWQRRIHSRHELEGLSDASLRDIGIARSSAHRKTDKLCWVA
jgi:uncharacterized protein YjiS (DUF1127 family)